MERMVTCSHAEGFVWKVQSIPQSFDWNSSGGKAAGGVKERFAPAALPSHKFFGRSISSGAQRAPLQK